MVTSCSGTPVRNSATSQADRCRPRRHRLQARVAAVAPGSPQEDGHDEWPYPLHRRGDPLGQAQITAALGFDDQPAQQHSEYGCHSRADAGVEYKRALRRPPGDQRGPSCRRGRAECGADQVAQSGSGRGLRRCGYPDTAQTCHYQKNTGREPNAGQADGSCQLTAADEEQCAGHDPAVGGALTCQHAHCLPDRTVRGRLQRVADQESDDQQGWCQGSRDNYPTGRRFCDSEIARSRACVARKAPLTRHRYVARKVWTRELRNGASISHV